MFYYLTLKEELKEVEYTSDDIVDVFANLVLTLIVAVLGLPVLVLDLLISPLEIITFFVWKKRRNK